MSIQSVNRLWHIYNYIDTYMMIEKLPLKICGSFCLSFQQGKAGLSGQIFRNKDAQVYVCTLGGKRIIQKHLLEQD